MPSKILIALLTMSACEALSGEPVSGKKYGRGAGLRILADGAEIGSSPGLQRITAPLPD